MRTERSAQEKLAFMPGRWVWADYLQSHSNIALSYEDWEKRVSQEGSEEAKHFNEYWEKYGSLEGK